MASLAEAGEELLTYYRFPICQWKAMRTTIKIQRLNGEFRRRSDDSRLFAERTSSRAVAVWVDHQWTDPLASHRRMPRPEASDFVTLRSFIGGLLKKKFSRHGFRKYEFPHNHGLNQ